MDVHAYPRITMKSIAFHGDPWICMDVHGYTWKSMTLCNRWDHCHYGVTLVSLWGNFGMTLDYFGITLAALWGPLVSFVAVRLATFLF